MESDCYCYGLLKSSENSGRNGIGVAEDVISPSFKFL